jgi:cell division protein FtsB
MKKITKIKIILLAFILVVLALGIWKSTTMITSRDSEIAQLKAREDTLVFRYANDQRTIDKLKFELTGVNQELEQVYMTMAANKLYIQAIESKVIAAEMEYQSAISYIETAEIIMNKIDIQYFYGGRR